MAGARLRLLNGGYDVRNQPVKGIIADVGQLAQLAIDDFPPRGMSFDETVRARDLLELAFERLNEEQQAKKEGPSQRQG